MEVSLPLNWKNLTIEKYDGTTDPNEYLDVYTTQRALGYLVGLLPAKRELAAKGENPLDLSCVVLSANA
ncbi:hypothetical protein JHK86_027558 [Glycine max]|nr:hypothetical protein JHK86_027558 [Glycine max]